MGDSDGIAAPPKKKARTYSKVAGEDEFIIGESLSADVEEIDEAAAESTVEVINDESAPATTIKFQCQVCKCYFITQAEFDQHSKKHKKKSKYKCMVCQFTSRSGTTVLRHVRRKHPTILIKFKCDECEEEFMSNTQLRSHKKEKHCNVCELCGKEFARRKYLTAHKKLRHTDMFGKQYKCINCSKSFVYAHMLKKHEDRYQGKCYSELMLPESESFVCSLCKKVFVELDAFQKHEQMHKDKSYECPLCRAPFDSLQYLRQHLNNIHIGKQKKVLFSCELCGKSYTRITALNEHIVNIHKGPRVYVCIICNTSCTDRKDLEKHRGIHFECLHCAKRHRSENLLLKHQMKCKLKNKNYFGKNDMRAIFEKTESMTAFGSSSGGSSRMTSCPVCQEQVSKAFLVDHLCAHAIKTNDNDFDEEKNLSLSDAESFEVCPDIKFEAEDDFEVEEEEEEDYEDLDVLFQNEAETRSSDQVEYKKPCIIKL